ncbi:hypothetical protein PABG_07465 [Paracoccidioides brasiliensis Pb03]|uniref:Pre-mRNA-splicing factor SPF27 n=1 Tax=Paracoccidioides brasiliensis (strain Pb18) TaxID=502780 RepID=C1GMB1_PARBD|nr:uncharacterized protein PADG_08197 [Paracoccidioides brasiliensis Pb18]EEH17304.1 hypothetical protein PABG_07465 [Paracoccidioides brasiliensis Pb03]EEH43577.1 hypothetical protein PADG_08197 [Paracoccidioides brasiliensis Pb18]ODH48533.1 hypothetical protein GX48_05295 [Paracoccidioides brasiliensis]
MPLINYFHDSLPYIDDEPTTQARAHIDKLISAELPPNFGTNLHPSLPALPQIKLSNLIKQELDRKEANLPLSGGIDLSRYEAPDAPEDTLASGKAPAEALNNWKQTLQRAYTASSHLSIRQVNLSLLDAHGKNAWLIGNSQLEDILRRIEKELQETKEATEAVHKERKLRQESAKGELVGLEDAWKRGVGGIIDVELAAERLRRDILETRRHQSKAHQQ